MVKNHLVVFIEGKETLCINVDPKAAYLAVSKWKESEKTPRAITGGSLPNNKKENIWDTLH